jgi:GTP-binding protein EngB required for normal cell division
MSDLQPSPDNLGGPDIVQRFRILVIGNANAGKTTILNKVCNGKVCNLLSSILLGQFLTSCLKD